MVLDVKMDLLDGTLAAVQLRRIVPRVPVMPFTSYTEALPTLVELGCVQPALKRPETMREMPERMRQAILRPSALRLTAPGDSVAAERRRGAVLCAAGESFAACLSADGQVAINVQRATHLLEKYCRRISTPAAREIAARV